MKRIVHITCITALALSLSGCLTFRSINPFRTKSPPPDTETETHQDRQRHERHERRDVLLYMDAETGQAVTGTEEISEVTEGMSEGSSQLRIKKGLIGRLKDRISALSEGIIITIFVGFVIFFIVTPGTAIAMLLGRVKAIGGAFERNVRAIAKSGAVRRDNALHDALREEQTPADRREVDRIKAKL